MNISMDSNGLLGDAGRKQDPVLETATFAAGCFWGVEHAFRQVPGVADVTAGYTGGELTNPSYDQVCSGTTGHAESVLVTYNPAIVSYAQLLDVYWSVHDPTQLDRQGPDVGSQYRSAIFYHDEQQKAEAEASMASLEGSGRLSNRIVTRIVPAKRFWPAEEYHQRFFDKCRRRTQ